MKHNMILAASNIRFVKLSLLIILAALALFVLAGTVLHKTIFKSRKNKIEPYGQMVDIFDGQMHLYKMGNQGKTIVLLPGLGTSLPSADFGPLMRGISTNNTVVCVEYFGVGFSSLTARERTTENYVEEIRASLSAMGIKPPYVLMPHSISSVYSEYYASEYPDEVAGIISLDGTSTAYIGEDMPGFVKSILGISKVQQKIGLTSILAPLTVHKSESYKDGYTKKEIEDIVTYAGFSINDCVLEQMRNSTEYIKDANKLSYPQKIPYYKIISKQTYETKNSQISISPQEYQMQHLTRVGAQDNYKVLDGTHFIYQNNVSNICDITDAFIKSLNS